MSLTRLDLAVVLAYFLASAGLGLWLARRRSRSEEGFFAAGRRLPGWLAAVSLVATSFSVDTPLGVAGLVGAHGIPGVWFAWCFAIGGAGMLGYALFAELWRRSAVLTDAELVELRYGGRPAAALRLVKALYFGVIVNALTLAWVLKAVVTLCEGFFDGSPVLPVAALLLLVLAYSLPSGLWGVVASDLVQFALILAGIVALAARAMARAGGPAGIEAALASRFGQAGATARLGFVPDFGDPFFPTFLAYALLLWWAHKNANAPGPAVQRLVACRDEREARRAALTFTLLTFCFNYWPMIALGLATAALYPALPPERGLVELLAHELPGGLKGLAIATLAAAFLSTADSLLNLGAAYLTHDVVRRFLRPRASERELVRWGRGATVGLLVLALALSLRLESVAGAWTLLAAMTSGYGLVTIARWFWWRVNAWSEIVALTASTAATFGARAAWPGLATGAELLIVVAIATPLWLAATWLAPATDGATLERFVARVRPWGVWGKHGAGAAGLGRRLGLWLAGVAAVFALNFCVGSLMLARGRQAALLATGAAAAAWLFRRLDAPRAAVDSAAAAAGPGSTAAAR